MPILLPANQPPDRFYRGGAQIAGFRTSEPPSTDPHPDYQPEDWVASTTPCFGCTGAHALGLTQLPGSADHRADQSLAAAVAADPQHWLGPAHVAAFGASTKLLVKLLDAGQRLPVHAHPTAAWAQKHIPGAVCGKAEAWYVLAPGEVWLGLREGVETAELEAAVAGEKAGQPSASVSASASASTSPLLPRMHRIAVQPGDTVFVPPGSLHAIGSGLLVVEVQEPSDMSILLEWQGFQIDGARLGHLGVGWPAALAAVDRRGRSPQDIDQLVCRGTLESTASTLAAASHDFFRLERLQLTPGSAQTTARPGFAVLIVTDGQVELATAAGGPPQSLVKGNTVVVPFADGELTLTGTGQVLIARPPPAE